MKSNSLKLSKTFLSKKVEVIIDRPLGTKHPKHGFVYKVNYGYIKDVMAPDGEELDVYYLGVDTPIEKAIGQVIAIIHRVDDDDDKLVVVPEGITFSDEEILAKIHFQEQWFQSVVVRK